MIPSVRPAWADVSRVGRSRRRIAARHEQVREAQEQRDPFHVLGQPAVANLPVTEAPLHIQERVLHLCPHRGLVPLAQPPHPALLQEPPLPRSHRHMPLHRTASRVLENLPDWARERAIVDDMGNIMVDAGPDRDTTIFMAHMDEVGYDVEAISAEGIVSLIRRGGVVESAWEGQTAYLHFNPEDAPSAAHGQGIDTDPRWKRQSLSASAPEPLRGVFLSRDQADRKAPPPARAWFGLNRAKLEARGVGVGAMVTSYKDGLRMGRTRFVARALDDRAGTTALLLAINRIDPDALPGKVVFTWSVAEEGGLIGAGAMARRLGASALRIYSVDTFVSSDTPLESPHFAYTPLGQGPVLRAIENSGVSPDRERARVIDAASTAGIPLQMGLTQGGTDGTQFTFWGAPNQGLSWPGRYSHSPGEVLDLRDLRHLSDLIVAVARTGER